MFNEHVYRCSLNNKRTISYISAENQQANKLCKILSFCVRRFFEHNVARFKMYPAQDGTFTKETIVEQHVNFESGRWFLCSNTHTKMRVRACWNNGLSVWESLNLIQKKKMSDFNSYHEQKMDEQSMGGWKRRKSFATGQGIWYPPVVADNFTLLNYNCLATSKRRKDNITN